MSFDRLILDGWTAWWLLSDVGAVWMPQSSGKATLPVRFSISR
jgi:hypothetical protein